MRIGLVPRVRPPQLLSERRSSGGESELPDPADDVNHAMLSGTIVEEPLRDTSREGEPITVLLVSFAAPDEKARPGSACCEVECADSVADSCRTQLRPGGRVAMVGQLTGGGGLWATSIVAREPRRPAD
jgi:hypothetical protein